jgi:hypothetical protein
MGLFPLLTFKSKLYVNFRIIFNDPIRIGLTQIPLSRRYGRDGAFSTAHFQKQAFGARNEKSPAISWPGFVTSSVFYCYFKTP